MKVYISVNLFTGVQRHKLKVTTFHTTLKVFWFLLTEVVVIFHGLCTHVVNGRGSEILRGIVSLSVCLFVCVCVCALEIQYCRLVCYCDVIGARENYQYIQPINKSTVVSDHAGMAGILLIEITS